MRAIILAAGRGRRLAPMGWNKPKCLLEIAGQTLLHRTLSTLIAHDIKDATIVVGHERSQVEQAAGECPINPRFVVNDRYDSTNTIHSLWLARKDMTEDFLYFNADVLFAPEIVTRLIQQSGSVLAVDEKHCGAEEVKVVTGADGRVQRIGKSLDPEHCAGEFIGVAKFDASICSDFVATLNSFVSDRKLSDLFFEAAVNELLDAHFIHALPIGDLPAIEIDTPEDFELACRTWSH